MTVKRFLYYSFEVLSWASLIMLSIGLAFFVRDIWIDFQEGKTNDRVYSKRLNYFEHPTITVCFLPQIKLQKLQIYNKTFSDLNFYETSTLKFPISPQMLSDELRYIIGRDFTIDLILSDHHGPNQDFVFTTYSEAIDSGLLQVSVYLSEIFSFQTSINDTHKYHI